MLQILYQLVDMEVRIMANYNDNYSYYNEPRRNRRGIWSLALIPVLLLALGVGLFYAYSKSSGNTPDLIGEGLNQRSSTTVGVGGAPGTSVTPTISPTPRVQDSTVSDDTQSQTQVGVGGGVPAGAPQSGDGGLSR